MDFGFLRDQRLTKPECFESPNGKAGPWHYKMAFTLVSRVVGRYLQCFAVHGGRVLQKCRVSIASGFAPGVK
ncbi:hypothetical protein F5Y15DRAFT_410930 [Xylariaceae sp. FL0016]|nr:hypothetical protein F5Y15DRAFT_410930 [Xylariaceae sp. FL0016]